MKSDYIKVTSFDDYAKSVMSKEPYGSTYLEMGELKTIYRRLKRGEVLIIELETVDYGKNK